MRQLSHPKLLALRAQLWVGWILPSSVWGLPDSHRVGQVWGHQSTPPPLRTITFHWASTIPWISHELWDGSPHLVNGKTKPPRRWGLPRPHCYGVAGLHWKLNRWYLKAESGFEREVTSVDVIEVDTWGLWVPCVWCKPSSLPCPISFIVSPRLMASRWLKIYAPSPVCFSEFLTLMSVSPPCLNLRDL